MRWSYAWFFQKESRWVIPQRQMTQVRNWATGTEEDQPSVSNHSGWSPAGALQTLQFLEWEQPCLPVHHSNSLANRSYAMRMLRPASTPA